MERDGAPACAHVERMLPALWVALATTVAPRPLPPHSLRLEYLGASPSDADSPPPPPALPGPCPPSADGSLLGGAVAEWAPSSAEPPVFRPAAPLRLACAQPGATITHVQAFYGTPRGDCRAGFTAGGCNAPTAQAVVDALCLHRSSCSVPTNASVAGWRGPAGKVPSPLQALFGPDPCEGTFKVLTVEATCSSGGSALHGRSRLPAPPPPQSASPVLGVDRAKPRFSWQLASAIRGDAQTAFELRVLDTSNRSLVWLSGKTLSAEHAHVEYGAPPLEAFGGYSWAVRWWGSAAPDPSPFSAPQLFTMAPQQSSWAAAEWVGGGNQLRSEFSLTSTPVSPAMICPTITPPRSSSDFPTVAANRCRRRCASPGWASRSRT